MLVSKCYAISIENLFSQHVMHGLSKASNERMLKLSYFNLPYNRKSFSRQIDCKILEAHDKRKFTTLQSLMIMTHWPFHDNIK